MKMRAVIVVLLISISCAWGLLHRQSTSSLEGAEKIERISEERAEINRRLPEESPKADVLALIGPPDNVDGEVVWVWTASGKRGRWNEIIQDGGYFATFVDGRLVAPLFKNAESSPEEVLAGHFGRGEAAKATILQMLYPSEPGR